MLAPQEVYIVDNLKTNVLIGINIMVPEKIDILVFQFKVYIESCDMLISVKIRVKVGRAITHLVYFKKSFIISSYF